MGPFSLPASKETRGIHNVAFPRRNSLNRPSMIYCGWSSSWIWFNCTPSNFHVGWPGPFHGCFPGHERIDALTNRLQVEIQNPIRFSLSACGRWRMVYGLANEPGNARPRLSPTLQTYHSPSSGVTQVTCHMSISEIFKRFRASSKWNIPYHHVHLQ